MEKYNDWTVSDLMSADVPHRDWPSAQLQERLEDVDFFISEGDDWDGSYSKERRSLRRALGYGS